MSTVRFYRTKATYRLLYDASQSWVNARALRLSAGVAYYALFALIPVLFLAITFASFFFGQAVQGEFENAVVELVGEEFAAALLAAIDAIEIRESQSFLSLISLGALIFTATLLFVAWKEVVDIVWGIPKVRGAKASIRRRLFGLVAVVGAGLLLTLNLAVDAIISSIDRFSEIQLIDSLLRLTDSFAPLVLGALFLGVLFKYTPDAEVSWRHVWFASAVSMAMLTVGAWGYGIYLDLYGFASAVGIAGVLLLGLVLVYYAVAILVYGMEIVRLARSGRGFVPLAFQKPANPTVGLGEDGG